MAHSIRIRTSQWLACIAFLVGTLGAVDSANADKVAEYRQLLNDKRVAIAALKHRADLLVSIVVAVGVAGVIVTALQGSTSRSARYAAAALGATVAGLTAWSNTFDEDHRAIRHRAASCSRVLDNADLLLIRAGDLPSTDLTALFKQVEDEFDKLGDLLDGSSAPPAPPGHAGWPSLVGVAFAAEPSAPSWVHGLGADEKNLFFVGFAKSSTLADAQAMSSRDAERELARYTDSALLSGVAPESRGAFATKLQQSAKIEDTWFDRDEDGGIRFYTLLRLGRSAAETDARLVGIREDVPVSRDTLQQIQQSTGQPAGYFERRQQVTKDLYAAEKQSLPQADFEKLQAARAARRDGDVSVAVPLLRELIAQHPDSFVAWYNLALALARPGAGDDAEADPAYRRAIELEPSLTVRDPSVYNSYGAFLIGSGKPSAAIGPLQKALAIDPKHPLAIRNLAVAESRARPGVDRIDAAKEEAAAP